MPDKRNRKRPIQVKFFVDEKEQALVNYNYDAWDNTTYELNENYTVGIWIL